ncbi:MAG: HAMP domain-containing sensor histidine kinase [Ferruginibacter sp.]
MNAYLLLLAAWLVTLSFIVDNYWSANASVYTVQSKISSYIQKQEIDLQKVAADTAFIKKVVGGKYDEAFLKRLTSKKYFLFFYAPDSSGHEELISWNTQQVLPFPSLLYATQNSGFIQLENGYYVWRRYQVENIKILGLIPVKWNYIISTDYLRNGFVNDESLSLNYDLSTSPAQGLAVKSTEGNTWFYLYEIAGEPNYRNNIFSVALRLLATFIIFLFIHLFASFIASRNFWLGIVVFLTLVIGLRAIGYFYPVPMNFRQFELFDPAIYGSGFILRSLGDLLINSLLFVWFVLFMRDKLQEKNIELQFNYGFIKWILLAAVSLVLLGVTYQGSYIIRSLVADSQISFDVINFFSLNIYSAIGFIVLCCLAIGYYFLCQILLYMVKPFFPKNFVSLFLFVAVAGLLAMSFSIGQMSGGFEVYILIWLMLFLFLLNSTYLNLLASRIISSKLVFWLFFFSISITTIIIVENNERELRNRRHYAEILSTKADPSNEILLNTMLTDFRANYLSLKFNKFRSEQSNHAFKDSLINGNFSGYTNKYATKIFTYTADEKPLFNKDPQAYNELNTILKTQTKPTRIPDLYYYDEAYDRFSYISKKTLTDTSGKLLGYVFVLASPKKFKNETLVPELFSRGHNNSIENSSLYAFAIYNNWKLISSHNDYPFATTLVKESFPPRQFFIRPKQNYNELWYRSGADKMVVIAKENSLSIESATLFSYLFCAFLVLTAIFWLINIIIRSRLKIDKLRSHWQLSIRNQIHGTIIFISVLSFLVIGGATILFFISRYENNNREKLSRTIHIMENEVKKSISNGWRMDDTLNRGDRNYQDNLESVINKISEIHGIDVNLYDLQGNLNVSSLPLPYIKGVLSTKMEPRAYYHLNNQNEVQFFQKERIGELHYVSNYVPVIDAAGNNYAYLNIPYFTSESNLKNEISNFLVTIINLNAFIFIIAGIVALFITNRITNSFAVISDKMKKINLEKRNEYIEWKRDDELGELVAEYNKMVSKLDESAMALAKTEREGAWREMARQVAHEIKNPLTPMKLSMQFLQKSIESNAPNIKELTESVARTLVEQIDHLSQIAGEFSQFANIENSKKEFFDVNEALTTVLHLYASNDRLQINSVILPKKIIIEADKTHINRLFTNLILNALQAIPEHSMAKVDIAESIEDKNVILKITDNGMGIAEDIRSKIFTPNFTTKTSGTGLGLAMCKRIVEQAKGQIWFETNTDVGTSFFVQLPIAVII